MSDRPSNLEDEYFAREDIEKKRNLAIRQARELAVHEREALKKLHYMHCPNCGMDLHTLRRGDLDVDMCFNCKGIWLDESQVSHLVTKDPNFVTRVMNAVMNIFSRK